MTERVSVDLDPGRVDRRVLAVDPEAQTDEYDAGFAVTRPAGVVEIDLTA